jgi:DNA primase catalytic core
VDLKDTILQRVDIVELIGQYTALKLAGREWRGPCLFHAEKTASFYVNPDKGLYHCFGCKAGGNAIDFVMRVENLEFVDALEWLARRYNIEIPRREGQSQQYGEKERLLRLNEDAAAFFREQFKGSAGSAARAYIEGRGLSQRTVTDFDIGYAPQSWDALLNHLTGKGARVADLLALSLVKPRDNASGHYDFFRHRVIFPIRSVTGRVIGFGGRAISAEDNPKYLNIGATALYDKSATLYNLDRAKGLMRDEGAVVVEGYMDVIGLAQAGIDNAVATCGTALTEQHVALLKRYTDRFLLAFDGDAAGRKASWDAGRLFMVAGFSPTVVPLPPGVDPADLAGGPGGAEQWAAAVARASSVVRMWLDHQLAAHPNADTTQTRRWLIELGRLYQVLPDELTRHDFVQAAASALAMGAGEVVGLLSGSTGAAAATQRNAKPERELSRDLRQALWKKNPMQYTKTKALDHENEDKGMKGHQARRQTMLMGTSVIEREVIRRLITDDAFRAAYTAQAVEAWFDNPQLRAIFTRLGAGEPLPAILADPELGPLLPELLVREELRDDGEQLLVRHRNEYLGRLHGRLLKDAQLAEAQGDIDGMRTLMLKAQEVKSGIRQVHGLE